MHQDLPSSTMYLATVGDEKIDIQSESEKDQQQPVGFRVLLRASMAADPASDDGINLQADG